ncbi:hypothetical protein QE152_g7343 [Popillia japonica]|uniref:Uncharacterized protein n=1 Tax=Popillia japonica TaxID=7064 RepID=A0AAW1ME79_POPJA
MLVCPIENYKKSYNTEDHNDTEILLQLMMESDEKEKPTEFDGKRDSDEEDVVEERNDEFDGKRDSDEEDVVEERNDDSVTHQHGLDDLVLLSSDESDDQYIGKNKIIKWKKTKYTQRVKSRPQDIVVRLPPVCRRNN